MRYGWNELWLAGQEIDSGTQQSQTLNHVVMKDPDVGHILELTKPWISESGAASFPIYLSI